MSNSVLNVVHSYQLRGKYGGCTVPGEIDLALNAITLTMHMYYPHTAKVAVFISGVLLVITSTN